MVSALTRAVAAAWEDGNPVVAGGDPRYIGRIALRRWRTARRRRNRSRVDDLARALRDHFEEQPGVAGPSLEDYRSLAERLAPILRDHDPGDAPHD